MNTQEDNLVQILRTILRGADADRQLIFCGEPHYPFRWVSDPPKRQDRMSSYQEE